MIQKKIKKQHQLIAIAEKSLAQERLKQRKADTRRKIELGGLVIKTGMDGLGKSFVLGALLYAMNLFTKDAQYKTIFESLGEQAFFKN